MVARKGFRTMDHILRNLYSYLSFPEEKQIKINNTINILKKAAPKNCSLENILEFSISENTHKKDKIRFGWFKIYNPNILSEAINYNSTKAGKIQKVILILKNQTPEYAFGMEWDSSQDLPRLKAYFLRLPDIKNYDRLLQENIPKIARELNISLAKNDYKNVYIIGIDFDGRFGIKIYERNSDVNFEEIKKILKSKNINNTYMLDQISDFKNHFYDTSFCWKYSKDGLQGVSIFFGIKSQPQINNFIEKNSHVKQFEKFLSLFKVESNKPCYTHMGLVYNLDNCNPKISLYFQPRFKQ